MFVTSRKQAQALAQRMLAGHCALIAWWTLRHAGVLEAIARMEDDRNQGLEPRVHATRTNMSAEVLESLLAYLEIAGLVSLKKGGARLTADGRALLEHEDGVLELFRAYQPLLETAEHLLAKLRRAGADGIGRRSEYLLDSQARRYAGEVYPALADLIAAHKYSHLLDISCGTGDLLIAIAARLSKVVGVGIGPDSATVRRANDAIDHAGLDKRLIAVTAAAADVCADTQRTFERIGVSRQLWKDIDCLIAMGVFSEAGRSHPHGESLLRLLQATRRNFPRAALLVVEPVASARFQRNYYWAELTMILRLAQCAPWPPQRWRDLLAQAQYGIAEERALTTDGLAIFLCRPGGAEPRGRS